MITRRQKRSPKFWVGQIVKFAILIFHLIVTLFPFYWMLNTALKSTQAEIYAFPVIYWPESPTLQNFIEIATKGNFLRYFGNSFFYATAATLAGTLVAILAAYVLSRCQFRGKGAVLFFFLLTQMLPGFIGLAPKYQMFSALGLVNTVAGILIIYFSNVLPYSIITLRAFFDGVPRTVEEAAMIDGCGRLDTVFRIAVPLILPGIASVLIFDFVNTWNELFNAVLFIDSDRLKTIPVALNALIQKYDIAWGQMMAGTIISILPTVLLFALMRKYMVAGLTSGAVKG